jgi:hypothetical protein
MSGKTVKNEIVTLLNSKAPVKQKVFDRTRAVFRKLKKILEEIEDEYNQEIKEDDKRINLKYEDRGEFVAQLKVAGDVLVFNMHSNAFEFDREHEIWKLPYSQENEFNTYTGVINIYNFLHDSFRYNRQQDIGYLVGRLFVNREGHFFVEGKRQKGMGVNHFGENVINDGVLKKIIEVAVFYSLSFDLLVPPYDDMKLVTLMQMNEEIMQSRNRTGKRLGFKYNADDVK